MISLITLFMFYVRYTFSASGVYINLEIYRNLPCDSGFIPEAANAIQNSACFNRLSSIIMKLCPYEQAVLINSLNSNDSERCFNVDQYKSQLKDILSIQLNNIAYQLTISSLNTKINFKCLNIVSEQLLSEVELTNIISPNKLLIVTQASYDSCLVKYLVFAINTSIYLRQGFMKPISLWDEIAVSDNLNKIQYFKFTTSQMNEHISMFTSLVECVSMSSQLKNGANDAYGEVFSNAEKCKDLSNSNVKTFTSAISEYFVTSIGDSVIKQIQSMTDSSNSNVQEFIKVYNIIKSSTPKCKKNAKSFILSLLNKNHPFTSKITKAFKKDNLNYVDFDLSNLEEDIVKYSNQVIQNQNITSSTVSAYNSLVDQFISTNPAALGNQLGIIKINESTTSRTLQQEYGDVKSSQLNDKMNLLSLLIEYPLGSLSNSEQRLINNIINEFLQNNSTNLTTFPFCLGQTVHTNNTCNFSPYVNEQIKATLKSNFYDNLNFLNNLITALSKANDLERYYPFGIPDTLSEIYDFFIRNTPDDLFIINNNNCYQQNNSITDCSDLLMNSTSKSFFFGNVVISNKKLTLFYYKDQNNTEYYDMLYGDIDICSYNDIAGEATTYFDINPFCQAKLSASCPTSPLIINSKTEHFNGLVNPNIVACSQPSDYKSKKDLYDRECFSFIINQLYDGNGLYLNKEYINIADFISENINLNANIRTYDPSTYGIPLYDIINDSDVIIDQQSDLDYNKTSLADNEIAINNSTAVSKFTISPDYLDSLFGPKVLNYILTSSSVIISISGIASILLIALIF